MTMIAYHKSKKMWFPWTFFNEQICHQIWQQNQVVFSKRKKIVWMEIPHNKLDHQQILQINKNYLNKIIKIHLIHLNIR
jgi:hypothetical protein